MTTLSKGTTVDTSNIQLGELIHMDFAFYNVTSIRGFTSILTFVCTNTIMLWVFSPKQSPVCIICFILKTLKNEQHQCKHVIVDKNNALENSIDVTNCLVDEFRITMETTGGDASWINGNN